VTALREACADIGWDGLLHRNIATFEGIFGEAGLFQRSLDVHAVVDDVGDKLCVGLCLVPATHNPKADVDVALLHEGRDNGVEGTLVSGERIGQAGSELESGPSVVEGESETGSDEAGAVAGVVALDKRDDVAVLVDGGEVDR